MKKRGFALIALIIIIVVLGIISYTTVAFVSQNLRLSTVHAQKHQAIMASQAGLMKAAYETLQNATYASAEAQLNGTQYYKYAYSGGGGGGGASSFVYINASASILQSSSRNITGWTIVNTDPTNAYTITHITVSWTAPSQRTLQQIALNSGIKWTGTASSGTLINITDYILPANSTTINNLFRFNNSMNTRTTSATFTFSDGTSISSQIYPAVAPTPAPGGTPTSLEATGKIIDSSSAVKMRQSILVPFRVSGEAIIFNGYNETNEHLLP